jgi:probable HAF family extracellular repeat protein
MRRTLLLAVLSLSVLLSTVVAAQDAEYTFTTVDVPGAVTTEARGINDTGQIVGWFIDATPPHGFVADGVTFTPIDVPGASQTQAFGINDTGQIVGRFSDTTGGHGFVTDSATFTPIDVPGAITTVAFGINDTGQIVGWFSDGTVVHHGFVATPDTVPPVITVAASPATLSPPNGRLVTVTVSGAITDRLGGSGVQTSTYQVTDEYGQIQPSGDVTLEPDGRYAFTVALQASRNGNDRDGRRYTIEVSATDHAGNEGAKSATVTVPRK